MIEILSDQYFWLSFLPISLLGVSFWLLLFDRMDQTHTPLKILFLALLGGALIALDYWLLSKYLWAPQSLWAKVLVEEGYKVLGAILFMEIFRARFRTVGEGAVYGFSIGLGFALLENVLYLSGQYAVTEFGPEFWLTFQGRFWSSTVLHGITTAFFGLFYASAYLAKTLHKSKNESPLKVFFVPIDLKSFWQVLTLHVTREHLLFQHHEALDTHKSRAVIAEGFLVAVLFHFLFNFLLGWNVALAFVLIFLGMAWLRHLVNRL